MAAEAARRTYVAKKNCECGGRTAANLLVTDQVDVHSTDEDQVTCRTHPLNEVFVVCLPMC